jgi:hypothetical protein
MYNQILTLMVNVVTSCLRYMSSRTVTCYTDADTTMIEFFRCKISRLVLGLCTLSYEEVFPGQSSRIVRMGTQILCRILDLMDFGAFYHAAVKFVWSFQRKSSTFMFRMTEYFSNAKSNWLEQALSHFFCCCCHLPNTFHSSYITDTCQLL